MFFTKNHSTIGPHAQHRTITFEDDEVVLHAMASQPAFPPPPACSSAAPSLPASLACPQGRVPAYLPACMSDCVPAWSPACLVAHLPAYLVACLPVRQGACLPRHVRDQAEVLVDGEIRTQLSGSTAYRTEQVPLVRK